VSLEGRQGQHNRIQASINNTSHSSDELINNAGLLASGRNLGMSDEEILAQVSKVSRRQKPAPALREDMPGFAEAVQAAKTLTGEDGTDLSAIDDRQGLRSIETRGTKGLARYEEDFTEEDTFQGRTDIEEGFRSEGGERYDSNTGGYVEESPEYRPATKDTGYVSLRKRDKDGVMRGHVLPSGRKYTDKDRVRPEERAFSNVSAQSDSSQTYATPEERKQAERIVIGTTTDSAPSSTYDSRTGKGRGPVADALKRIQTGDTSSRFSPEELAARRARVFGTSAPEVTTQEERQAVERRIIQSIDVREQQAAEQAEVERMMIADRATRDPEKIQEVQARASAEAEQLLLENRLPGQNTTEQFVDLGAIERPDAIMGRRAGSGNIYYTDEFGRPIAETSDDIELLLRGDPNKADTAQQLNAARPQSAPSWIIDNQPDYYQSETSFGNYPQTDSALARSTFANKVRELSGVDEANINLDVRSAADLQRVQQAVEEQKAAKGQALFRVSPSGEQVVAGSGDVRGLMHALKMTGPEQSALASAIAQETLATEGADRTSEAKTIFGVNPNETGVDSDIAKVPANSTIRVTDPVSGEVKRRNIRAELAQLDGADAQQPFIGAVIDPVTGKQETDAGPRARSAFKPGNMGSGDELEGNLRRQAISRQKPGQKLDRERLKSNIMKARGVEEREAVDRVIREARAAAPGEQPARIAEDNQFARESARRDRRANEAELDRLAGGNPRGAKPAVTEPGGALVSLTKQITSDPEPASSYYDGSSQYDVASRMEKENAGIQKRAQQKADISERLKREITSRAMQGRMNRNNRIKQGLLAALGVGAGVAGINDAVKGDEGIIRY